MSEKYKSRKSEPVYLSTYDNGGWPARDELPTKNPIGDVEKLNHNMEDALRYAMAGQKKPLLAKKILCEVIDEWVEGYKTWEADQKAYEMIMRPNLKVVSGKGIDFTVVNIKGPEKKCTCGAHSVYGKNIPTSAHTDYCDII